MKTAVLAQVSCSPSAWHMDAEVAPAPAVVTPAERGFM